VESGELELDVSELTGEGVVEGVGDGAVVSVVDEEASLEELDTPPKREETKAQTWRMPETAAGPSGVSRNCVWPVAWKQSTH